MLSGVIPDMFANFTRVSQIQMGNNQLSDEIPASLGNCQQLQALDLSWNKLNGSIPEEIFRLSGLNYLILLHNMLWGPLPKEVGSLKQLQVLDVSEYNLFRNFTSSISGSAAGAAFFICLIFCFVWALISTKKKKREEGSNSSASLKGLPPMISYSQIRFATSNFAAENLIGKGAFGSVYRGTFGTNDNGAYSNNSTLAVTIQSFHAECEALRSVRLRNLVKIITSCSSVDYKGDPFKSFVMDFMPGGSLDKWLYPEDEESGLCLTLLQRLNIAVDVASVMDYLHHDCEPPVVHYDLKPANVLLDENMAAHVGDFGLARFLSRNPSQGDSSTMGVKGSIGYIAPGQEYGPVSKASTSGDVYSFGVLLLEMLIAKKPTDGMFKEGLSLNTFASAVDSNLIFEITDPRLLKNHGSLLQSSFNSDSSGGSNSDNSCDNDDWCRKHEECLASVIRVGLCCAAESPKDRLSMREALTKLHNIKKTLLN
ncbi:hypothetical protein PTKIN_Ptkin17bG0058500 [Pterospermum kingtungense]